MKGEMLAARLAINVAKEIRVLTQEFEGMLFVHIREYVLTDDNEFAPTAKGIAVPIDKLDGLVEAVRELRSRGTGPGNVSAIELSRMREVRFAVSEWKGTTKADIRIYGQWGGGDMAPSRKGVRFNLGLLPELERALHALKRTLMDENQ